jgi:hypothetical protein
MKEEHHPIWVKLRAEVIKHFHDTYNAGKFNKIGFDMSYAIKIAQSELKNALINGNFLLTIDEMLMCTLDECVQLVIDRHAAFLKKLILS